jgi:hypothetical protein
MFDLLRFGRVVLTGLRVFGRYRAATVIAFVLASAWFLVLLGGRSNAAGRPHPVIPVANDDRFPPGYSTAHGLHLSDKLTGSSGYSESLGVSDAVFVSVVVCVGALVVLVALCFSVASSYNGRVRDNGESVRDRALRGHDSIVYRRRAAAARERWIADGRQLETLISFHDGSSSMQAPAGAL